MAISDILGLFASPQQYEQQRQAAMEAQALQTARLSPMEQGQYGIALGAQQLGRAIGGALGGVDPQLQKITQRQQLLGMIDPSNPDSYAKAIQAALQTGDQEAAFLLRNEMMRAQEQASVAENRRFEREGRLIERGEGIKQRNMESRALSIASGIDPDTGDPTTPLLDPTTQTFNQNVANTLISQYGQVGANIVTQRLQGVQGIESLQTKQLEFKALRLAKGINPETGEPTTPLVDPKTKTINQDVASALITSYGQAGANIVKQTLDSMQGIESLQVQQLAKTLFNEDGTRNPEVEKKLSTTVAGRNILKTLIPETKILKRGDIISEQNPVTGAWEVKTPTGLKTVPAGANPIKAMIDTKAIDKTVIPFANEIASQWDNLDDKGRADSLESLTKVNNTALDRNQRKAEAGAGGSDKVQSSKVTPDGTTILVMKNGTTRVISSEGIELKGQARTDAIKASEDFGADVQERRAQGRGIGELSAKQVGQAFVEVGKIKKNLGNIDEAIAAIDAGASSGVIASKLPNITAASIQLANVRNQLGLDVIGSVTFGALSEGELNLALDTALPTGLAPKDLRAYLVNKKTAQTKLAGYLTEQATYLSKKGNTLAGWLEKVENRGNSASSELPAGVTVKRKN